MLLAFLGGSLIGLSASLAHAGAREVVGVSGLVSGVLRGPVRPFGFGLWFLLGLVLGGGLFALFGGQAISTLAPRSFASLALAGLLVGFGTRLGGGCTSGHGVCGISRLSPRSFVATGVFMATAAFVVLLMRHVFAHWGAGS